MKFLKGLLVIIEILSFWMLVFFVLPISLYILICGVSSFQAFDILGVNFYDPSSLVWQTLQVVYETP